MINFKSILASDYRHRDIGLLIVRLGIGLIMMLLHGYGKISGGPEQWERLGSQMQNLGIEFGYVFWGFMAAVSEFFGSLLLTVGLLFRPAVGLLAITMFVAAVRHLSLPPDSAGAGWKGASHALELLAVYVALYFTGPGKYRLSALWEKTG